MGEDTCNMHVCNMQSGNMSSFPKTQEVKSTNNSCKLSSDLHTYVLVRGYGNTDGQRRRGEYILKTGDNDLP